MTIGLFIVILLSLLLGYGMHRLIKKYINPRLSVNHMFLYFIAHFVGVFFLSFLIAVVVIKNARFLFRS